MTPRDERAADVLADRDVMECPECGGTGLMTVDPVHPDFSACIYCGGSGYWVGAA